MADSDETVTILDYFVYLSTHLVISLRQLARHGRQETRRARRDEFPPDITKSIKVALGIAGNFLRKVETVGAIDLEVYEARRDDAVVQIYN